MSIKRSSAFLASILGVCLFWPAPPASAQCSKYSSGFMDIGLVPNKPFQAEKDTGRSSPFPIFSSGSPLDHPQLIARDSQGRVRVERIAGKYKMQSGPDQGQELDEHLIYICDPVAQTLTQIDSVNRTAKISHQAPPSALPGNFRVSQTSLCATKARLLNFPNSEVEDLGHKQIQGFEAQGFRFTMTPATVPAGHTVTTSVREEWCSEELGAVLLQTLSSTRDNHTNFKTDTTLTKIERVEPDLSLFQIPPDYTISELIPTPAPRRLPFTAQTPAAPAGGTSPPQK